MQPGPKSDGKMSAINFLTIFAVIAYLVLLYLDHFLIVYESPVICFLLLLWFIALIGVGKAQEWGRKLLIITSIFISFYLMFSLTGPDFTTIALIFLLLVVILAYMLPKTKAQFRSHEPASAVGGPHKKILVIDDDKALLKMIRASLIPYGLDVVTADTGEKGLELAKKKKPDLIILDVILPGLKGRQVCARLKEDPETKNIPVMFLTAKDSPDDVKAEMDAGALMHLTKPLNPQQILSEIKKVLGLGF